VAESTNDTARYLVPLLAFVAAALVTGLGSTGRFDRLEILRLVAAGFALWLYRDTWRAVRPNAWSWTAPLGGLVVFFIWMALEASPSGSGAASPLEIDGWPRWQFALWISSRLVGSVLVVPLIEELAFRGFLLRRLVAADFTGVSYRHATVLAVVVSSVAFGALHERWIAGTVAGLVYAGVAYWRGRLGDAVLAHSVTNALIASVALGTGRWSLWG
jgi:CAAX prenyl protease-like protein